MPTSNSSPTAGEQNNPEAPAAKPFLAHSIASDPPQTQEDANKDIPEPPAPFKGKTGEVWATYTGQGSDYVERTLSVADLKGLGDKNAKEPLVWNKANRHHVDITDAHPMVAKYIEEEDGNFTVERF